MVSTRLVIALGLAFLYFSFGTNWLYVSAAGYGLDVSSFMGNIGPYVTRGVVQSNLTIDGEIWVVLLPQLVGPGPLLLSIVAYPLSWLIGAISLLVKWKWMLYAGLLCLLSAGGWALGVWLVSPTVNSQLNAWLIHYHYPPDSSIWLQVGPYLTALGGAILVTGYFLSKSERLDYPLNE